MSPHDSDSDSSISIDPDEFRKVYERQLKKAQDIQKLKNKPKRQEIEKPKLNSRRPVDNIRERQRSRQDHQQRTENIRWHIYEEAGNIDYLDTLPQKLRKLPIFHKKNQILQKIIKNQIVLITGDTGCGKSTQVPRLIYEYLKKIKSNDKIICVQPRRLAVTSLKSAVQKQIPQSRDKLVGYQIGMKAEFNTNSRIVFMTNGIFLQRIVHDTSFLNEYPFVILDEVHQRDIDTDFILTAIKRIIRQYPKARIVLMSATIDNQLFRYYFASDHIDQFMNQQNFYKQIIQIEEYEKIKKQLMPKKNDDQGFLWKDDSQDEQNIKKQKIYDNIAFKFLQSKFPCPSINVNQASNYKRTYFYLDTMQKFIKKEYNKKWGSIIFSRKSVNTHKQLYDMACIILDQIKQNTKNKKDLSEEAVLVFLPGLAQIQSLSEFILQYFGGSTKTRKYFDIIHVHSTIMNDFIQSKINNLNHNQIKLIIATNIAQSSITVKGVKYVLDFCLTKQIKYDLKSRMENLELSYTSKASSKQRAGRTGRVCDGLIFRMVQKKFYQEQFQDYSEPEIKRSSLDKLILRIKMMHQNDKSNLFKDPPEVLGTCIQPPKLESIETSINSLKFCGGLQQRGDEFLITQLGKIYVQIPIDISYTKMLLMSIILGTYPDILILISILSQNKSPFHRKQIQKNFSKYIDMMQNYQYCDFLSLVNTFKLQKQTRQSGVKAEFEKRLRFDVYIQTNNTIRDIQRRINKKKQWFDFQEIRDAFGKQQDNYRLSFKCKRPINQLSQKTKDYLFRFKMTLTFGFIDKFILVKQPNYDQKQQKRIRFMKKFSIPNQTTIVLLNSSVITKPLTQNREAQQRLIKHWKSIFKKTLQICIKDITLGSGLAYLHFQSQKDLNKLLFIKYMDSNVKRRSTIFEDGQKKHYGKYAQVKLEGMNVSVPKEQSQILTLNQILECLGDLDHMQEGVALTHYQEKRLIIDSSSVNRAINVNQGEEEKIFLTNSFMLQNNNSLVCRYTTQLSIPSITTSSKKTYSTSQLTTVVNLLFYPFIKLHPNQTSTSYSSLTLKRKHHIKIPYDLTSQQIEQANFIRAIIKSFLENKLKINSKNCMDFYKLIKKFVYSRKRKQKINQKDQLIWQNQFITEIKTGNIAIQPQQAQGPQSTQSVVQNRIQLENQQKIIAQKVSAALYSDISSIRNITHSYQTRNFMNPIQLPQINEQKSYFLRPKQMSSKTYQKRIQTYLNWKLSKLAQIQKLRSYAQDNDSYLCCAGNGCLIKLCKMKRIGPIADNGIWRDLYQPIQDNIKTSTQQGTEIDVLMENQNIQHQYRKITCNNNHQLGIRVANQTKVKILIFSNIAIKYPDNSVGQAEFQRLQMKYWQKNQKRCVSQKQKKLVYTSCWTCNQKLSTFDQLKCHIQDLYHTKNVESLIKSIERTKLQLLGQCKDQEIENDLRIYGQDDQLDIKEDLAFKLKAKQQEQKEKSTPHQIQIQY